MSPKSNDLKIWKTPGRTESLLFFAQRYMHKKRCVATQQPTSQTFKKVNLSAQCQ